MLIIFSFLPNTERYFFVRDLSHFAALIYCVGNFILVSAIKARETDAQ